MRKRRAIIFDDEKIILHVMKYIFSAMHYDVITYAQPMPCPLYTESASACTQEYPCADVVIMDYRLPRMNGLDLIKQQAANGCKLTPRNKAVMSAGLGDDEVRSIEALGSAYFEKPIELDELAAWVTQCEKRINLAQPLACRRREVRFSDDRKLRCSIGKNETIMDATAVNISDSGICLRIPASLEKGQIVRFETGSDLSFQAAIVRWARDQRNGSYLAGLSFC